MPKSTTVAFGGSGDIISPQIAADLLNDFFSIDPESDKDNDVFAQFPITKSSWTSGLDGVWEWTGDSDILYDVVTDLQDAPAGTQHVFGEANDVAHVTNVNVGLIDALQKARDAGDDVALILLWGSDDGGEDGGDAMTLLGLAQDAGIKVYDLLDGLDEMVLQDEDDEPAQEEEPEPEPEPAPKPRASRTRRSEPLQEPEPEPLTDEPMPTSAATGLSVAPPDSRVPNLAAEFTPNPLDANAVALSPTQQVRDALSLARDYVWHQSAGLSIHQGFATKPGLLTVLEEAMDAFESLLEVGTPPVAPEPAVAAPEPAVEAPKRQGQPRKGAEEGAPTTPFYLNEDGIYRKAGRGRPPTGVTRVELTDAEVERYDAAGQVDSDD